MPFLEGPHGACGSGWTEGVLRLSLWEVILTYLQGLVSWGRPRMEGRDTGEPQPHPTPYLGPCR